MYGLDMVQPSDAQLLTWLQYPCMVWVGANLFHLSVPLDPHLKMRLVILTYLLYYTVRI